MTKFEKLSKIDNLAEKEFFDELVRSSLDSAERKHTSIYVARVKGRRFDSEFSHRVRDDSAPRKIVWHTSDEKVRNRGEFYSLFDAVIRSYFDPRLAWKKNVVTFPLGYLSGFMGEPLASDSDRANLWSFCGAGYAHRRDMLKAFDGVPRGHVHIANGWTQSPEALSQEDLFSLYADSDFVLCPAGVNHFDSFRIMEALQAGAIPVCVEFLGRDFLKYTFGSHPMIIAKNWQEAAEIIQSYAESPSSVLEKRREVQSWYQDYRKSLFSVFRMIALERVPKAKDWEPLRYQKRSRWDIVLMARVRWWFRPSRKRKK